MTDYKKYIYALRKCAKEHEHYRTMTGRIIVSDLCRDTANLLEELEQEPILDKIKEVVAKWKADDFTGSDGFAWDCMKEIADIVDKGENEKK